MTARRPLIAGNWKMYKTGQEAVDFVNVIKASVANFADVDIMIAPAFTALTQLAAAINGTNIGLGAQNLYWEAQGAYTGEISTAMLQAAGCQYVIIGHSERRQYFAETDQDINRKIDTAAKSGLISVFCRGETEYQRDAGDTFNILDKQIKNDLEGSISESITFFAVAYEPVWAIGTGKATTSHLTQTNNRSTRSASKKRNWISGLSSIGAVFLGVSGGKLFDFLCSGIFPVSGTLLSIAMLIVGTILLSLLFLAE